MKSVFLATKGKTSQKFDEKNIRIPVTTLLAEDVYLVEVKSDKKNGYNALKLAIGQAKRIDKPTKGQLQKSSITHTPKKIKEVRLRGENKNNTTIVEEDGKTTAQIGEVKIEVGQKIAPDTVFKIGDLVDVTGESKGKGFQGGVKRHGFHGGPKTHGQSDRWRAPGSVGATTTPGRTFKGQRMAGRMGNDRVTVQRLKVVEVGNGNIVVKGLVPGNPGELLEVRLSR